MLDYVFDGTSPPYGPASHPNPLQLYGKSKRDGETAISSVTGAKAVIIRVPVLSVPPALNPLVNNNKGLDMARPPRILTRP